jgi:hypothetical protein
MITQERLKEVVSYDPSTGCFHWIWHHFGCNIGKIAGHYDAEGYRHLYIDKKRYRAHNLAWLFIHGFLPNAILDHVNGNPADNRIENLRECNASKNAFNKKRPVSNTSGIKGIWWRSNRSRWEAVIKVDGVRKFRKMFKTLEDAEDAVRRAREEIHGEFARHE